MPFSIVTAGWIAKIFLIYTLMVVILSLFVMRGFLEGRRLSQKFVFAVVWGNFFYIMLVQFWGLFHVSNRYVLLLSTLAVPGVLIFRDRKKVYELYLEKPIRYVARFVRRENSFRFLLSEFWRWLRRKIRRAAQPLRALLRRHFLEGALFLVCSAFLLYYFSVTNHYGPRASDLVVHMSWINQLDDGVLYGEGIYPFGMHALIYYMHAVFNIPTARIVLLFGAVQTFYIITMLLMFMKEICRFRYTPYLTYIAFVIGDYILDGRFSRYYSTLPQEFGMMFLLPCAIALIRFFRAAQTERQEYEQMREKKMLYTRIQLKRRRKESSVQLWLLIISFGLTLSAHFYITIVAGLLVIAAAVAYVRFLFDWGMLRRLIVAAVISLVIPIAPMAAAFAMGTPLQGSLYWALEVMGIEESSDEAEEEETPGDDGEAESDADVQDGAGAQDSAGTDGAQSGASQGADADAAAGNGPAGGEDGDGSGQSAGNGAAKISMGERLKTYAANIRLVGEEKIKALLLKTEQDLLIWCVCMVVLVVLIPVMWLFREWEYSRFLVFVLVYTGLLLLLLLGGSIGLPTLVDENRASIFCAYTLLACVGLAADGILVFLNHIIRVPRFWRAFSFVMAAALLFVTVEQGRVKEKIVNASSLQRDGAALCVYDIMENYPEKKWTIVSCNEERQMVLSSGWHYEVIDFLDSMEHYRPGDEMYIPTQYVFFFIEKEVLNYSAGYEFTDVDPTVSEEWASYTLPVKSGLSQYAGIRRIITNSRMYYWAQEYQKRFPNEMKVFYEDEEFICYMIEQNEYYLNNFAIDYGYNSMNSGGGEYDQ